MVRETRHLWVGNLPENIREDRIREHFKRYGRLQSVKLLPRAKEEEGATGLSATVAFVDIKSASKAHNMEQKLDERCLSTEYYEPPIPGTSQAPLYAPPRFPRGVPEEHVTFDRTSLFYERGGNGGGGGGGGGGPREGDAYLRRAPASGYHVAGDPLRGRGRERSYRNGPLPPPYTQIIDRPPPPHHRPLAASTWNYEAPPSVRYPAVPPTVEPYTEERRDPPPVVHKKRPKSSRSGSESGSNTASSRSRSRTRSRSSSSSSNSASSTCSSGTSSPVEGSPHSSRTARSGRVGGVAVQSTVSTPHANNASPAVHTEDRRSHSICVRNLPIRSSDTSLKDGLFHEYKKHGKVTWVKVVGLGTERYALVCFKKPEDVEKALEISHDKLFFGCKIEVAPYQGYDVDDNESRPYEAELDEYHPKATRTLFIGNLEKDVTASELRKHFEQFGEIIEIDIKKQGVVSSYAFCQYADITSVVKAMRTMDGEHLGNNRIKLGFGKSMPTNCVWVDGVAENVSEKYLNGQFHQFGSISHVTIDRERGHALVYFEQIPYAQEAVRDMRGVSHRGRKLQVDFASRECQETFYEHLEKQGHAVVGGERPWDRYDNNRETPSSRFDAATTTPTARFARYEGGSGTAGAAARPRPVAAYGARTGSGSTPPAAAVGSLPPAGAARPRAVRMPGQRYAQPEFYDDAGAEYPERRYSRSYDDVSQGSPGSHDDPFDHADYGYCPRASPAPVAGERSVAVSTDKVVVEEEGYKRLQSVVTDVISAPPPPPPDMRHLQKERVHLLEQLEECPSSGDDDITPIKRPKVLDNMDLPPGMSTANCFEPLPHETSTLVITTHNHRKSISEVRRLSDASGKHCGRRPSCDSAAHPVCKRRKTGEGEERCRKHTHHHHHHSTGDANDAADGSRPGTPLCDERPENLLPPSEPRRPRERASEGPLSLPLPRFASQVLTSRVLSGKPVIASPPHTTSPRVPVAHPPPSPSPAPPPSSPPPRPPSLPSSSSSDSEMGPPSPTLEERIRSLDEKYEKWSGSRNILPPAETMAKLDAAGDRFRFRHKLLDLNELKPSDIVRSVLAKPSVFDEDSKRLENVGDKYEPKEFAGYKGAGCFASLRVKTESGPAPKPSGSFSPALSRVVAASSPLHSPNALPPKSPFAVVPTMPPSPPPTAPNTPKTGPVSPRAPSGVVPPPAAKGLQYPFPSHPPVLPPATPPPPPPPVAAFDARTCVVAKPVPVHQNDPRSRVAVLPPTLPPTPSAYCVPVSSKSPAAAVAEISRTSVKACEETITRLPTVSFPTLPGPIALSTPPVPAKKACASTVAPTLPPRITTAVTGPPASPRLPKPFDATPKSLKECGAFTAATVPSAPVEACVPATHSAGAQSVTVVQSTTALSATTHISGTDQSKPSAKPKLGACVKVPVPNAKRDPVVTIKKEKEDSKIISSHRSKSLEEKKERKESASAVCQRRESEGADRRLEKDRKREKDSAEVWDLKKEIKKECVEPERKDVGDNDRLGWGNKAPSDIKAECTESLDRRRDPAAEDKWREHAESSTRDRWKERDGYDKERKRENHVDQSRVREASDVKNQATDSLDRRKDSDVSEHLDRRKDKELEQSSETNEKRCDKEMAELIQRRKSTDGLEKRRNRDSPENAERRKEVDIRHDCTEASERRKERESADGLDKRKERSEEDKRRERRKERANSANSPAVIGAKRRISSQDGESDETKRPKLGERRDSKDSGRSSGSSSKRGPHHSFAKPHDGKHEGAERKRHDHEKLREKLRKKNREGGVKVGKEASDERETSTSPKLVKRKEDSDPEDREDAKQRHLKRELLDKKRLSKDDLISEFSEEKAKSAKKDREKRGSSEKRKEDTQSPMKDELKALKKESRIHKMSNSDTDSDDEDGPKKHSIFDIVDDGPAYISMYDKVKARSTKNMQKQEEEKRQEKMREKFSLLKASRAKREEKKRSTSWDEDSDSDMDPEARRAKRAGKPVISSSSEDEGRRRHSFDSEEMRRGDSGLAVKKEDLGLGDSDSDSHHRVKPVRPHDDEVLKHASRKTSRSKLISDTSDDDTRLPSFKPSNVSELYSAESDADQGFADADVDERHPLLKKSSHRNHSKFSKSVMDSLNDEAIRKPIVDISKGIKDKNSSLKKSLNKSKSSKDWSDEEKSKAVADKSDVFDEDKLAAIFKSKSNNKIKTSKSAFNSSDEEQTRKQITEAVKAEIFGDKKHMIFNKKSTNRMKVIKRCLDSSDDDLTRKLLSSTPKADSKIGNKIKNSKNSPDSFDEENTPRPFASESDKSAILNDISPVDKYNSHTKTSVLSVFADGDHNLTTPTQTDKKSSFFGNSLEKSVESSRKKAHKKKQKRLKELLSGEDGPNKTRDAMENHSEIKLKSEKKHKRERRKSDHGDDQNKANKIRKKKLLKPDGLAMKADKRDGKMEDIFGPISDDSESGISSIGKSLPNGGHALDKLPSKWQVSMVYGSDSDSVEPATAVPNKDRERRRRDRKRRDRKARSDDGTDMAEAGRALEAKLLGGNDFVAVLDSNHDAKEADEFPFNDDAALAEKTKEKEKKKKRKKSKEEKQNKHHHHHHHDKKSTSEAKSLSDNTSLPLPTAPSLPSLDLAPSDAKPVSETLSITPPTVSVVPCKISPRTLDKKKADKFIPSFDAAIHETAVKSISEFEPAAKVVPAAKPEPPKKSLAPKEEASGEEDKPRAVISQEETEDAVAALLGESFGADFGDCYDSERSPPAAGHAQPDDEETRAAVEGLIDMKPDTPQSEPDLQIDTDTEEDDRYSGIGFGREETSRSSDNIDFSKPPKTPDMPASYYRKDGGEQLPTPPTYPKAIPLKEDSPNPPSVPARLPAAPPVEVKEVPKLPEPVAQVAPPEKPKSMPVVVDVKPAPRPVELPKPVAVKVEEKLPEKLPSLPSLESAKESQAPPSVIKAASPTLIKPVKVHAETVIKTQESAKKDEVLKERLPMADNIIKEFKPYRLEEPVIGKGLTLPLPAIKEDNKLVNNIDFGRLDKAKQTENMINQEDDFSEPETDLKSDTDLVTNLLKSDSLTRGLSVDDSTPEMEKVEMNFKPFNDTKLEPVSVIKEMDSLPLRLSERDAFAHKSLIISSQDPMSVHKENHSDFMNDAVRADTGFWSAKEVNIDSVIKKVDALCSAEDDERPWLNTIKEKKPLEVPAEVKLEVPSAEVAEEVKENHAPGTTEKEKDGSTLEVPAVGPRAQSEDRLSSAEAESVTPDMDSRVTSGSSPEEDTGDANDSTPQRGGKSKRGAGTRRKTPSRAAVATRRTRLAQKPTDGTPAPVSPRRGGRPPKSANRSADSLKVPRNAVPQSSDVYEFHDDSEDEGAEDKSRPRLIVTIKSPVPPEPSAPAPAVLPPVIPVVAPSVAVAASPADETEEQAGAPAANTRKSRRLQERDGSRSTVDDTIEDVVRGAAPLTRGAASRRQVKLGSPAPLPRGPAEPRKSPRAGKRSAVTRVSESQDDAQPRKSDEAEHLDEGVVKDAEVKQEQPVKEPEPPLPTPHVPGVKPLLPMGLILKPRSAGDVEEPMTLIDPVTGLLIPMRESEEGQYIPVTSAAGRALAESVTRPIMSTPVAVPVIAKSPVSAGPKPTLPDSKPVSTPIQQPVQPPVQLPSQIPPKIASVTKPPVPTVTTPLPVNLQMPAKVVPTKVPVQLPTKPMTQQPLAQQQMKPMTPQPLVQQQMKPMNPQPSVQQQMKPMTSQPSLQQQMKPMTPQPLVQQQMKPMTPQPLVQQQMKPLTPQPLAQQQMKPMNPQPSVQLQMKSMTPQPLVQQQMKPMIPQPSVQQQMKPMTAQPLVQQQMKPLTPQPPLVAYKPKVGATPGVLHPKPPAPAISPSHKAAPVGVLGQKTHQPPSPAVHATASPPKAHQGHGPPPILTGAVASPPLKSSQQPVVTGASSSRAQVPNVAHGKGMMIPPKVEVSMGGCMPSASPQPQRGGQVMQAGLPVPAYEAASMHAGTGGVGGDLRANPQFVMARRQSPPPAHQHGGQGDVVQHVFQHQHGMRPAPHEMAYHNVHPSLMYQQYLRAHIPYHQMPGGVRSPMMPGMEAKLEADSDEPRASSPPLELRRPASSSSSRTSNVPHSLQSPHDRLTDSPQVATVYMHGSRIPHYTPRYYETEPPPAHVRTARLHPLPGSEAPPTQPMMQVATPPHASQVPPQADSLLMLLQRYPVMWQGLLALKNDQAAVQMHFVFGNPNVARDSLPCNSDGSTAPLRIAQRMRLEQTQVEGVARKMQMDNEHCMLLALPCGRDHMDVLQQSNNLQTGFITYLQQKQAAGIVNIAGPVTQQAAYVVHIFPSCDFANENLARIAPDLLHRVADIAHLLIIIATV